MSAPVNRSLARGLDMLALLSEAPKGLTLSELSKALNMPKSSAHNLVHTLRTLGYVRCNPDTEHYTLTTRLFQIGAAAMQTRPFENVLRQEMLKIYEACNETVHCGVPEGGDVVYVDKIESSHSIRMTSRIGARMPLYCTAMGRAILAAMDDASAEAVLRDCAYETFTAHTIVDRAELQAELARVREQGYAIEREETNENVCCVGVAIRDALSRPRYAVSISMPVFRVEPATLTRYAQLLLKARARLENHMRIQ